MDYNNGKIYAIRNRVNNKVYIGSTTQSLAKRFSYHKASMNSKDKQHYKLYQAMHELGIESFYIELIEHYPCQTKEQLCAQEGSFIRERNSYNDGYNGRREGQDKKEARRERYVQNIDRERAYWREYAENNRERIRAKGRAYVATHKDEIKAYHEAHKTELRNNARDRYERNRDMLREKHYCSCGGEYQQQHRCQHFRTQRHQKYLIDQEALQLMFPDLD